jgi:predicted aminopeptidase
VSVLGLKLIVSYAGWRRSASARQRSARQRRQGFGYVICGCDLWMICGFVDVILKQAVDFEAIKDNYFNTLQFGITRKLVNWC